MLLCRRCGIASRLRRGGDRAAKYLLLLFGFCLLMPPSIGLMRYFDRWTENKGETEGKKFRERTALETGELRQMLSELRQSEIATLQKEVQGLRELLVASRQSPQEVPTKPEVAPARQASSQLLGEMISTLTQKSLSPRLQKLKEGSGSEKLDAILEMASLRLEGGIPALTEALQDSDPLVRSLSARVLGVLGAHQSVGRLMSSLKDPEPWVRKSAAQALARLTREQFIFFEDVPPEKWEKLQKAKAKQPSEKK
jgi:hypothetical protein